MTFPGLLADAVVLLHLAFVIYVLLGGLLVLRWPRSAWLHLPAVAWGAATQFAGLVCPLTPLENRLREAAGNQGYGEGFITHYLLPLLYPGDLPPYTHFILGGVAVAVNGLVYALILRRRRGR